MLLKCLQCLHKLQTFKNLNSGLVLRPDLQYCHSAIRLPIRTVALTSIRYISYSESCYITLKLELVRLCLYSQIDRLFVTERCCMFLLPRLFACCRVTIVASGTGHYASPLEMVQFPNEFDNLSD